MWEQWSVHCTVKNQIDETHLIILQSKSRECKNIGDSEYFCLREREKKLQHSAFNLKCGAKLRSNVHLTPPILPLWSVDGSQTESGVEWREDIVKIFISDLKFPWCLPNWRT